ncbi:hypothetical protein [Glaciecola sp. KUL10]|uniref:hypothetical protein n=1 Tax=Glaciecola sp. (strain KUL10) TaxID=2161813 RepID=UPI000D78C35E|nr:hypothetical protein [Glaciecola sp. KUL10]GBL06336.1 hypothetical protein KUL10_36800 [Glaciecola sp. KUL10]
MELKDSELRKVKIIMLTLMSMWLLIDIALILYEREPQYIIRLFLTLILFYFVYVGKNWARLLLISLFTIGVVLAGVIAVYLAFTNIVVGLVLLAFTLFISILPVYLAFNKNAKEYFKKTEVAEG